MLLSSPLTVVGLMNGMIGGVILVLPVSSHQAGYIFTIIAILISGFFSFYSCYLSIKHLGDQTDMNYSMLVHFNYYKIAKIIYDIVVWLGLLLGSMFYYALICIQWENMTGGRQNIAIPLVNAAFLFGLIFVLKYFDFGASLMAYGIVSIFSYLIFLIWVISSTPKGPIEWVPVGDNLYTFGATMSLAFAIQAFFIPVLMKNPKREKHVFLTSLAYLIGAIVYFYISFMGSFGIMNRIPNNSDPQTIQDFFKPGNKELIVIQSIYLIHLYSCLPQFVLISKKRLFNAFRIIETQKGKFPFKEIIYSFIFLGICLLIRLLGVKIDTIIAINGAIVGFFNIYFFPAIIHIKCLYFSKNKIPMIQDFKIHNSLQISETQKPINMELGETKHNSSQEKEQQEKIRNQFGLKNPFLSDQPNSFRNKQLKIEKYDAEQNQKAKTSEQNQQKIQDTLKFKDQQTQKIDQQKDFFVCNCQPPQNIILKILQLLLVIVMVGIGAAIMVNGLISVI